MSTTYKSTDIDRILARIDDLEHLFDEYCVLERLAELEAKMQAREGDEAVTPGPSARQATARIVAPGSNCACGMLSS